MKKFTNPTIVKLEKIIENTKQCKMFGMPKRSCKSQPSGIFDSKEKK
jgi:hypothetical protein